MSFSELVNIRVGNVKRIMYDGKGGASQMGYPQVNKVNKTANGENFPIAGGE